MSAISEASDGAATTTTATAAPRRKRVRFCPSTRVEPVTPLAYPPGYFYSPEDYRRFQREAREEAFSPALRTAFDAASSSTVAAALLIVGLMASTVACLPALLLLRLWSIAFSRQAAQGQGQGDLDSSVVRPECHAAHRDSSLSRLDSSLSTERLLMTLLGASLSSRPGGGGGGTPRPFPMGFAAFKKEMRLFGDPVEARS